MRTAEGVVSLERVPAGEENKPFIVAQSVDYGLANGQKVDVRNSTGKIGPNSSFSFCKGAGDGFNNVVILIAAAALFAAGMKSIGLTGALVDAMKGSQSVAMISAAVGPFLMAVVSGSGNAAALAFNEAITPHAADFGMTIVQLGAVAQIAAGIGRTMSPVAGGVIILAGIAGVNPMQVVKRTALPCVAAVIVTTIAMFTLV